MKYSRTNGNSIADYKRWHKENRIWRPDIPTLMHGYHNGIGADDILTEGLIGYYPLGKITGNTSGATRVWADVFNRTVILTGPTHRDNHGEQFDGVDDVTDTGSDCIGTSAFDIMILFKPYTMGEGGAGVLLSNGKTIIRLTGTSSAHQIGVSRDGGVTEALSTAGDWDFNKWNCLRVTSTAAGVTNIYLGQLDAAPTLSGAADQAAGTPEAGTGNVMLGNNAAASATFEGMLGDVIAYNLVHSVGLGTQNFDALIATGRYVQPVNLLTDGGMEGTLSDNWTATRCTLIEDTDNEYDGSKCAELNTDGTYSFIYQNPWSGNEMRGKNYTLAAMCKCEAGNTLEKATSQIYDGVTYHGGISFVTKDGAYHRSTITATLNAAATQIRAGLFNNNSATSDSDDVVYFDNAILVEGTYV